MEAENFRNILQHFGDITIHNRTQDIGYSILYGAFIVIFPLSIRVLLKKGFNNRATWVTFITTLVGFLISTLVWVAQIAASTITTRTYATNNVNTTLEVKMEQSTLATYVSETVGAWGENLLPIISDAVVIWRAWVLFPQQKWVMIAPLLLLLGSFATTVWSLGINTSLTFTAEDLAFKLVITSSVLSLATNLASTLVIFWKLWTYRKFVRKNLRLLHRPSIVQNILVLLVESGVVYFALQTVNIVFTFVPAPKIDSTINITGTALNTIYLAASGMYPTIVAIFVYYESSKEETYGISALMASGEIVVEDVEARPATVGHLSFVAPQTTTGSVDINDLDEQTDVIEREMSRTVTGEDDDKDSTTEQGHVCERNTK